MTTGRHQIKTMSDHCTLSNSAREGRSRLFMRFMMKAGLYPRWDEQTLNRNYGYIHWTGSSERLIQVARSRSTISEGNFEQRHM
jgi:hypothetical protein